MTTTQTVIFGGVIAAAILGHGWMTTQAKPASPEGRGAVGVEGPTAGPTAPPASQQPSDYVRVLESAISHPPYVLHMGGKEILVAVTWTWSQRQQRGNFVYRFYELKDGAWVKFDPPDGGAPPLD